MLSSKITVPVPKSTSREFNNPLLCGPGPCDLWPSVEKALTRPVVSPLCDEYQNIIEDIRAGLKYLFQTQSDLVLAISGSGHAGMETVISNLVGPKETLLIASRGTWDDRAFNMATRYVINAVQLRIPFDTTFTFEQIETELQKLKPTAVFTTHGDSSTGTVQNLEGLGNICHKYGAVLLVDTVVSIGGVPFFMDKWCVDAVYASSQKALSGPAGISPVAFSAMAEETMKSRKFQPPFYFDIKLLALQWNCYGNTQVYHHTMSPPLMWALSSCLEEICNRTLPLCWKQHEETAVYFHKRLEEHGFKLIVPKVEDRLVTATTVQLPQGYDYPEFTKYIMDTYHHTMSPPLMWALSSCLEEICNRTLPLCWKQHEETAVYFHKRLEEHGFKLIVPKVEDRLVTATTVQLPQGYDYPEFTKYIMDTHNISISCGSGPTVGKALRIGIMGVNCTRNVADTVIDAMVDAVKALKKSS